MLFFVLEFIFYEYSGYLTFFFSKVLLVTNVFKNSPIIYVFCVSGISHHMPFVSLFSHVNIRGFDFLCGKIVIRFVIYYLTLANLLFGGKIFS